MRNPVGKKKFDSVEQLKAEANSARVQILNWEGPGWYYLFRYTQPCPRGCCYDSVFEAMSAATRIKNIKEQMRDLAWDLKDAKNVLLNFDQVD